MKNASSRPRYRLHLVRWKPLCETLTDCRLEEPEAQPPPGLGVVEVARNRLPVAIEDPGPAGVRQELVDAGHSHHQLRGNADQWERTRPELIAAHQLLERPDRPDIRDADEGDPADLPGAGEIDVLGSRLTIDDVPGAEPDEVAGHEPAGAVADEIDPEGRVAADDPEPLDEAVQIGSGLHQVLTPVPREEDARRVRTQLWRVRTLVARLGQGLE